jgi:hypothetical protein
MRGSIKERSKGSWRLILDLGYERHAETGKIRRLYRACTAKRERMNVGRCERCHDERFVCEQHPLMPFPHGVCAGPGIPCPECQREGERAGTAEGLAVDRVHQQDGSLNTRGPA